MGASRPRKRCSKRWQSGSGRLSATWREAFLIGAGPRLRKLLGYPLLDRATDLSDDGRQEEALALVEQAFVFGESVYALTVRGRFNGKAGDFEAGRQDLQRAIELAPWEDAPYHRLAHLERSAGSWDAALAAAELALAINPNDHYTSLVQKARKTVAQARVWEEHQARLWTDPAYTLSYFLDRLYANAISSTAVVLGLWALSHSGGSGHSSSPPGTSISTSSSRARPSNNGPPGASFI